MTINAVVDRIEGENAILFSEDIGVEISIHLDNKNNNYSAGDILSLTIDKDITINGFLRED
jgi:hypothetical protein